MQRAAKFLWIPATLALLLAIYWPALRGEFVWDDELLVKKNPIVTGEFTPATIWFRTDFPLSIFGLWLQWSIWSANPIGFHVMNLALHFLNTLLLWRVLARLKIPAAEFATVLFAVHPLGVASMAWVSEFKNVLSLTFALTSVWCWSRSSETDSPSRFWYAVALVAFTLALLAKTSVVVLPLLLLALDWWRKRSLTKSDAFRLAPFFLLALGFGAMTVWFQQHQLRLTENLEPQSFASRIVVAGMALWFYFAKILLPIKLCAIYSRWQPDTAALINYLPILIWCSALVMCWWFRARWGRSLIVAFGCFTAALFPVLGFFNFYFSAISRVSDHFVYLPMIPVIVLVAATLKKFFPAKLFIAIATALPIVLAVAAHQRARVYASDEALWRDTLAKNPKSWTAHNNLACILAEQHRFEQAEAEFEESLKLNPRNASAHLNLGRLLAMREQFEQAQEHFSIAVELKPDDFDSRVAYANALAVTGNNAAAIKQFREAIRIKDSDPEILNNAAWLLATSADASIRNGADAVRFAERACQLTNFERAPMVGTLAASYAEAGRFDEAVDTARKAVELANAGGDSAFANVNRQLMHLYQNRRAFHQPSPK